MQKRAAFICGTPTDRQGFDLAVLGPDDLPGEPKSYLDRTVRAGPAPRQRIFKVDMGPERWVGFDICLSINPSDVQYTRGAYICSGVLVQGCCTLHALEDMVCLALGNLHSLQLMLSPERTLPGDFQFARFASQPGPGLFHPGGPSLIADVLLQLGGGELQLPEREWVLPFSPQGAEASPEAYRKYSFPHAERMAAAAEAHWAALQEQAGALESELHRVRAEGEALKVLRGELERAWKVFEGAVAARGPRDLQPLESQIKQVEQEARGLAKERAAAARAAPSRPAGPRPGWGAAPVSPGGPGPSGPAWRGASPHGQPGQSRRGAPRQGGLENDADPRGLRGETLRFVVIGLCALLLVLVLAVGVFVVLEWMGGGTPAPAGAGVMDSLQTPSDALEPQRPGADRPAAGREDPDLLQRRNEIRSGPASSPAGPAPP